MSATDSEISISESDLFHEPPDESTRSGLHYVQRPASPYIKFLQEEGIPIHRGIGVRDVREVELGPWARMGANGAYMRLNGLDAIKSIYVLEIPGGGATNPEKHLYHEFYLVIEGRGTTETWLNEKNRQIVEWQPGSLFMIPPNVHHRLVNALNEPALLLSTTNLPPMINMFRDSDFIFNAEFNFSRYYSDDPDFYRFDETLYAVPSNKRAQVRSNYFPDIVNCELPLDNQRAPGYRRIQPGYRGLEDTGGGFIAQYPPGRYSRAHRHGAGALLVCLRGRGYTYNWPVEYGTTPWQDGHGDKVEVLEYVPGGFVAAAPGGGAWFHQHFGIARDYFRVLQFTHGPGPGGTGGEEGEVTVGQHRNISEGGNSIGYAVEDPFIRRTFEANLAKEGLTSEMPEDLYVKDV